MSVSRANASSGLDRAALSAYDQADSHIETPLQELQESSSPEESDNTAEGRDDTSPGPLSFAKVRRVSKKVRSKTKAKTSKILHTSTKQETFSGPITAPALAPTPSSKADTDRLFHSAPEHKGPQVKDLLHHPVDTVQSVLHGASGAKVAEVMDNQVIAHGADVNLVRAHDQVASAANEEDERLALEDLEELKKARQDTYVRWTMDRHVLKVRRIPPHNLSRPHKKDYEMVDERGKGQVQWATYGQALARFYARKYGDQYIDESPDLPPATEEALNTSFERLLMTSLPYQTLLMKVRHISRWDNSMETGMWLGAYMLFWAVGQLGGAAMLCLIVMVVRRRLSPPTVEDLRRSIKRSEDVELTATNFTQLIEQHGSKGWVNALIKELGPSSLLQITDLANALEILRNFYEWRSPFQTMLSLALLATCWLYIVMTPLWLIVRTIQFSFGLGFFVLFPIASRFPQYRIVVSPLTWLFWKIPTDAEWAIARLQAEAHLSKEALSRINATKPWAKDEPEREIGEISPSIDIGKYHCTSKNHHGDLVVTSEGVRYVTAVRSSLLWKLRYDNVKTLSKLNSGDGIGFVMMDDSEFKAMGLKLRNEAFTQILGYSSLMWQVTG